MVDYNVGFCNSCSTCLKFVDGRLHLILCLLQIKEKTIDYTDDCRQEKFPFSTCSDFLKNNTGGHCICHIKFNLTENFEVCTEALILYCPIAIIK